MNCEHCNVEIKRRKDRYELCYPCYQKALENQRLLWQELAEWAKENKLHVLKVTIKGDA